MVKFGALKMEMMTIRMPSTMEIPNNCRIKNPFSIWCEIFDPQSKFVDNCNHFFLFVGLFSLFIDPYFHYLPIVNDSSSITLDLQLGISVALFRVFGDSLLVLGMIFKFRTAYEDQTLRAFGKRKLVNDPKLIAMKYLRSSFTIDLLASLPLPQFYIAYHILAEETSQPTHMYDDTAWLCEVQMVPRALMTLLIYRKIEKTTGIAIKNPWSGTLYILIVYGMISHFLGAVYYQSYIHEILICRELVAEKEPNVTMRQLDQLAANCSQKSQNWEGLPSDAFANNVGSRSFTQKFMFCFSWGLKTLSSMGQNLNSSDFITDTIFNLAIIIIGLLVFADLIARMQTCMQSVGEREEQQMVRQRELEEWTNFHQLPPYLKKRVWQAVQSQVHTARGIDDEAIVDSLPLDMRCEIRRHLYFGLVQNLPIFKEMEDQYLQAICGHMRIFIGAEGMFVALEGDPVRQVIFVLSGELEIFSIDDGSSSCTTVGPGGFCGQELLAWSLQSCSSTHNLPSSTRTVKCSTDVEAFSLLAKDVKLLAIQFNYDQNFLDVLLRHSS